MKRFFLVFATVIFFVSVRGQIASDKYLTHYIKVWGFLKYYHPSIAGGKVDADSVFLRYIVVARKIADDKTYRKLLLDLQQGLNVEPATNTKKDTTSLYTRNDRSSWITNDRLMPEAFRTTLLMLRKQGFTDSIHQYLPASFFATDIPAEKRYDNIQYPNVDYQLLTLARYWNAIEYLFPYKYMITKNWESV